MYLLTASGTFTASQYESIVESTKQAIDGLLNVFTALMPVYAILGAAMFGIAFVLLLVHIIEGGCDMEKATAPLTPKQSYEDWRRDVVRDDMYYNESGFLEPAPPGFKNKSWDNGPQEYRDKWNKDVADWYDSHDMFGREKF